MGAEQRHTVQRSSADVFGTKVRSLELVAGWGWDSRNATLFPTAGTRLSLGLNTAVPGSDVEYYVGSLDRAELFRLPGPWRFRIDSDLYYGEAYGTNDVAAAVPQLLTAAGPARCAASRRATSGRVDSLGNPYGGNLLFTNQFELIIPTPEKFSGSTRIALFYDMGNVFSTGGVSFLRQARGPYRLRLQL